MNNYIDYEFYTNTYKGDLIPLDTFDTYCRKATQYIKANTFNRIEDVTEEVKMCCCELCNIIYKADVMCRNDGITSEKVGEYSVSYEASDKIKMSKDKEMNEVLRLWLADTGLLYKGGF